MNQPTTQAKSRTAGKPRKKVARQVIVNPGLQLRMLIPLAVFGCFIAVLMYAFVIQPLKFDAQTDPSPVVRSLLSGRAANLEIQFWIVFGFAFLVAGLLGLVYSNRVAGPAYKLRVALSQLADGNLIHFRFRRGDEMREFEDVVGRLCKRMEILSAGNERQLSYFQKRLTWLKMSIETQSLGNQEICKELESALKDAGIDQYKMKSA